MRFFSKAIFVAFVLLGGTATVNSTSAVAAPSVSVSAASAGTKAVGEVANVWGTVTGYSGGEVRTQVLVNGKWSTSQISKSDNKGYYAIPLTYGANKVGKYRWRVAAKTPDGKGWVYSAEFDFIRTGKVSAASAGSKLVGQGANVWGTVTGHTGGEVRTQVLVNGKWSTSQASKTDGKGYYAIPLTYGANKVGKYRWRVAAKTPQGWVYSAPFDFIRIGKVSAATAGSKPVGQGANVWGTVSGYTSGDVRTQVLVNGKWSTSGISKSDGKGYYAIPLTYGANGVGVQRWRVAAKTPQGWVYSADFDFVRTGTVNAGPNNGIIQPGDDFGGCTTGPAVLDSSRGWRVFTAEHCNPGLPDGQQRSADGLTMTSEGNSSDAGNRAGVDARWWRSSSPISQDVSTSSGGVAIVGVLRPWPGMRVFKSGQTSGVSSGVVSYEGERSSWGIDGMLQCRGDSGSPAYVQLPEGVFLVGMVNRGSGSLLVTADQHAKDPQPGDLTPNGQCAPAPRVNPDSAEARGIDAMCSAASLNGCLNDAGRVFGSVDSITPQISGVRITGWAFDATDVRSASVVRVKVDGIATQSATNVDRPGVRNAHTLPSDVKIGFDIQVSAKPGVRNVCITIVNQGPGVDKELGCSAVTVPK